MQTNEGVISIGSEYDWRCYLCGQTQTTTREGDVVKLPKGWVLRASGHCFCAACKVGR